MDARRMLVGEDESASAGPRVAARRDMMVEEPDGESGRWIVESHKKCLPVPGLFGWTYVRELEKSEASWVSTHG